MESETIPETLPTVPELLREVGYTTACLSPNSHLSSATGLDRGFDDFSWIGKSTLLDTVGPRTLAKYALNVRHHGGGLTLDSRRHHRGYLINETAKRKMKSFDGSEEPFFLYAHHGGPHHPYTPPRRFLDEFSDGEMSSDELIELAFDHHDNLFEYIAGGCQFTDREWEALRTLYDAEIAYADELVGDLFDYTQNQVSGETVFVVTADHGELFGERDLLAHLVTVNDAVSQVPLVVSGVDSITDYSGSCIQHADVMRTLLETIDAETNSIQGIDMRTQTREHAVIQRGERRCQKNLKRFEQYSQEFETSQYHQNAVTALRSEEYKYVHSDEKTELYRLPDEENDVSESCPQVATEFAAELDEWLQTTGRPYENSRRDGEFTDAMRDQLADLGYIVD